MAKKLLVIVCILLIGLLPAGQAWAVGNCGTYTTFAASASAADFNNSMTQAAITNTTFQCLDDYSDSATVMRKIEDP